MTLTSPVALKESFLTDNQEFAELETSDEAKAVGKLEDIDLEHNEVWLMQCPKGFDLKNIEGQKLKMPGRTNLHEMESLAVEFTENPETHAFAHCNRKGNYDLRLLPIQGTIVLRKRISAAEPITDDRLAECCPPQKRVPMPRAIRVRHPLLGHQYEQKLDLDASVKDRLQAADKISADALKATLKHKLSAKEGSGKVTRHTSGENVKIKAENDDDVVFVSEEASKKKKKKSKRKQDEEEEQQSQHTSKAKKSKQIVNDDVSTDLKWLQDL